MTAKHTLLGQPLRIGNMVVKNRMVMSPMNTNYSDAHGCLTQQMESYYIRRAQGGVGLIVLEAVSVSPNTRNHGVQPMLYDAKYVPRLSNLIEQIHSYGTKVSIEIAHFGSEATLEPRVSSSDVTRFDRESVKPLSIKEIHQVVKQFAQTIAYAKMAGADAVTLHGAHGYLIAEFLSTLYNKRTDEYGGSLENRARFVLEIIREAKKLVGKNFPIIVRYSVHEFAVGGRLPEESVTLAKLLEAEGVAAIDLSAGIPNSYIFTNPPNGLGNTSCMLAPYAELVKKAVSIPVIVSNSIRTPVEAENILQKGQADLIGLARPLLADADYCRKAIAGRDDDIRQCLSCQHCFRTLDSGRSLRCAVNPETGCEYIFKEVEKSATPKKLAVIGGGPAGMESARVAALRGHDVTLFELELALGGALIAAAIPPNKEKIGKLIDWYVRQLVQLNVKLRLDTVASMALLKKEGFETVMYAGGADYDRRIKGCETDKVTTAVEVLTGRVKVGRRVVLVGGGATGCETAEWLLGEAVTLNFTQVDGVDGELLFEKQVLGEAPHDVTIVEMLPEIACDMDDFNRRVMLLSLPEKGAKLMVNTMVEEVTSEGVHVLNHKTGKKSLLLADTVILAAGLRSRTLVLNEIENELAGDCEKPGTIADAMFTAYSRARRI